MALLLNLYHPADMMMLKVSVMDMEALKHSWTSLVKTNCRSDLLSNSIKYTNTLYLRQFLAYLTLAETEDLTRVYPLSTQPELSTMSCVLSDAQDMRSRQ